jgi:hypothetical protein
MQLAMARLTLMTLLALGLAACSQNEQGRKVIAEQCIAGGWTVEVCECLARESDARLDPPMFEAIVLGAQGNMAEADLAMQELDPQARGKFAVVVPQILKTCGAEGYLPGG